MAADTVGIHILLAGGVMVAVLAAGELRMPFVITSYSIHYTKLYDVVFFPTICFFQLYLNAHSYGRCYQQYQQLHNMYSTPF